jgi:hypothetical protein
MSIQAMDYLRDKRHSRSRWREHFASKQSDLQHHVGQEEEDRHSSDEEMGGEEETYEGGYSFDQFSQTEPSTPGSLWELSSSSPGS